MKICSVNLIWSYGALSYLVRNNRLWVGIPELNRVKPVVFLLVVVSIDMGMLLVAIIFFSMVMVSSMIIIRRWDSLDGNEFLQNRTPHRILLRTLRYLAVHSLHRSRHGRRLRQLVLARLDCYTSSSNNKLIINQSINRIHPPFYSSNDIGFDNYSSLLSRTHKDHHQMIPRSRIRSTDR